MKYHTEPTTTAMWWAANEETRERIVDRRFRQDTSVPTREARAMGQLGYGVRNRIDDSLPVMPGTGTTLSPFERREKLAAGSDCEFDVYEDALRLLFISKLTATDRLRTFSDGTTAE